VLLPRPFVVPSPHLVLNRVRTRRHVISSAFLAGRPPTAGRTAGPRSTGSPGRSPRCPAHHDVVETCRSRRLHCRDDSDSCPGVRTTKGFRPPRRVRPDVRGRSRPRITLVRQPTSAMSAGSAAGVDRRLTSQSCDQVSPHPQRQATSLPPTAPPPFGQLPSATAPVPPSHRRPHIAWQQLANGIGAGRVNLPPSRCSTPARSTGQACTSRSGFLVGTVGPTTGGRGQPRRPVAVAVGPRPRHRRSAGRTMNALSAYTSRTAFSAATWMPRSRSCRSRVTRQHGRRHCRCGVRYTLRDDRTPVVRGERSRARRPCGRRPSPRPPRLECSRRAAPARSLVRVDLHQPCRRAVRARAARSLHGHAGRPVAIA